MIYIIPNKNPKLNGISDFLIIGAILVIKLRGYHLSPKSRIALNKPLKDYEAKYNIDSLSKVYWQ